VSGHAYSPVRIDAAAMRYAGNGHDNVQDEEDERQKHAEYHNGESRTCADQSKKGKIVVPFDDVDQLQRCEDPPWVPEVNNFSLS
jgi:hypothetical protein